MVCPFIPCPGRTNEIYPKPPPLHHRARPRRSEQKPSCGPRARAGHSFRFCLDARAMKRSQPPALVSEGLPSRVRMRTDSFLPPGGQALRFGKSPS